ERELRKESRNGHQSHRDGKSKGSHAGATRAGMGVSSWRRHSSDTGHKETQLSRRKRRSFGDRDHRWRSRSTGCACTKGSGSRYALSRSDDALCRYVERFCSKCSQNATITIEKGRDDPASSFMFFARTQLPAWFATLAASSTVAASSTAAATTEASLRSG